MHCLEVKEEFKDIVRVEHSLPTAEPVAENLFEVMSRINHCRLFCEKADTCKTLYVYIEMLTLS